MIGIGNRPATDLLTSVLVAETSSNRPSWREFK